MKFKFYFYPLFLFSLLLFNSGSLYGAGYSISDYTAGTPLGRARAGGAAVAEDATTVFSNSAGLTRLSGQQLIFAPQVYAPSILFKNNNSIDTTGATISGGEGGDAGIIAIAPSLFYSKQISDRLTFGFAMNSPFGLTAEFDLDWAGRYSVVKAALQTINLNPSVGYKINDKLSIGAGVSLQFVKAELSSMIDYGAVCLSTMPQPACASIGIPSFQSADGFLKHKGDDFGFGFNLGALWEINKNTRVGLSYRSKVDFTVSGEADFTNPQSVSAFQPAFTDTNFDLPLTVPESASLSIHHYLQPSLAVMADVSYTGWSQYKELRIKYDNSYQPNAVAAKDWHDTWRVSVGLDYTYNPKWRFQTGLAYDETAIPDETFEPSIPSSDFIWLSLGARYQYSKNLSIGLGYTHVFIKDRAVNLAGAFGDTLRGEMNASMEVIGVQFNWLF